MKKTKEIWVPARYINEDGTVLTFENYKVSNMGRVKSLDYNHTGKAKILRQSTIECNDGSILYTVCICKDCKKYNKTVHRLVLSSFDQEGWSENACVDHIEPRDSGTCDNRLVNLRWFTRKENVNTVHCKELTSMALTNRSDQSKRVRVTNLTTGEITEYPSTKEAERSLGMPLRTVSNIIRNQKGFYKKMNLMFSYIE